MRHFVLPVLSLVATAFLSSAALAQLRLQNDRWQVVVDPATFALEATVAGLKPIRVSSGLPRRRVDRVGSDATSAVWRWDGGAYSVAVRLEGDDLKISVTAAAAGVLDIIDQPAAVMGRGLILPRAEGYYVPAGNEAWLDFVADRFSPVDTSQDLSLPLVGMDRGAYTLTWIWETPFNNELRFSREGGRLALRAAHEFTSIDPKEPLRLTLHLDGPDLLAGAKRYRRMLIDDGHYERLADKLAAAGAADALPGAVQIYLWGNALLGAGDIADWPGFFRVLNGPSPLARDLRAEFDDETRTALAASRPARYERRVVLAGVNAALTAMARKGWQTDAPDWTAMTAAYARLKSEVAAAFGTALSRDVAAWGATLSGRTFEKLREAGIRRAWIGLGDGWEGGLWNPDAVRAGVAAGYLVAPYDSYQTALPTGFRPDWATAALGKRAYETCAVIDRDGRPRPGFRGAGHYTSTSCVRPVLEARTAAIIDAVPFNSWFLDAYATGMVFDSYAGKRAQTMRRNAEANEAAARWMAGRFTMPIGSEDGNATTSGGIALAHGMQVPVFGWGDEEMMNDRGSPYFLGRWYPADEPEFFFKPVPVKEPFRTVLFGPATRLPLYQSVFHGSLITANHWHFDSLKLADVRRETELVQLLYNVPPLYHLSQGTLKTRLPVIARQQAFFRPLHQRLATQELTSFRYLSDDRLLQETVFADGTRLVANMSGRMRETGGRPIAAYTIVAFQDGKPVASYQSQEE